MENLTLKEKQTESIHRILDAAIEVFAEVGYEGARVDEIAERAGVNKAMIYYRIGDKKTLYDEVIRHVLHGTAERIIKNIKDSYSPEEKLKNYIANISEAMAQHPTFPRIMMREMASGWINFNIDILGDMAKIFSVVKSIIDDGVEKGVFRRMNPILVHLMSIGTMMLLKVSMPIRKEFINILPEDMIIPDDPFFHVSEIQKMMLGALQVKS